MIHRDLFRKRVAKVAENGSFLIMKKENLIYLSGTDAATLMLVPMEGDPLLFTSRMEGDRTRSKSWVTDVREYQRAETTLRRGESCIFLSLSCALLKVLDELGIKSLSYDDLPEKMRSELSSVDLSRSELIEKMRVRKSREEIRLIEKARAIAGEAYQEVSTDLDEDLTEMDFAGRIFSAIMSRGGMSAFEPIVAFEENSALPHHDPGSKRLSSSSVVLMDLGARVGGYCSDITRTMLAAPGPAEESLGKVKAAIDEVVDNLEPGMVLSEADALARKVLGNEDAYFLHSLGHGLGINIHEAPTLSSDSEETLEEGMVFTIEPGLYYRGRYGVRWEEDFVCWRGKIRII